MNRNHRFPDYHIVLISVLLILMAGCSSGGSSIPTTPSIDVSDLTGTAYENNRVLWAYNLVAVDPSTLDVEVIPVRDVQTHWNVLQFVEQWPCDDCFRLSGITVNPDGILNVDVTIRHPFSNPNLTGFDVRGIAMFNGSHGFPASGQIMSDRTLGDGELLNADGYTTLYNITTVGAGPGGMEGYFKGKWATIPAPNALLNGYKRFVSDDPNNTRNAFYASDTVKVTYEIKMPDDGFIFGYAVDACWAPPISKPVEDPMTDFGPEANCPEAWKIEIEDLGPGLHSNGGTTKLQIDVYDCQGNDDEYPVLVECPELFDGTVEGTWISDDDGFSRYEAVMENGKSAPPGSYLCLISKEAQENDRTGKPWLDLSAYLSFPINVGWFDGYPIDVTPSLLNHSSNLVVVEGDYGYIARGEFGLHIFDLSDPANPVLVNMFDTPGSAQTVVLSGGFAYVADGDSGLQIIDVSTPESAYTVSSVLTPGSAGTLALSAGYAYVLDENLQIIDIDPPESAYLVSSVATPGSAAKVEVSGGYTYVVDSLYSDLYIIDIDPPESASIVNSIEPYYPALAGFTISGDYAYLLSNSRIQDSLCSLQVIDIQSPESADVVGFEGSVGRYEEITVAGGYAYVGIGSLIRIIDVDPRETPNTVGWVDINMGAMSFCGDLAYVANDDGLHVVNVATPESAYLVKSVDTPGSGYGITLLDGYAYEASTTGIQIINIESPESAYFVNSIDNIYVIEQVAVSGDYAYVAGSRYFQVIDIDPPESAYVLKTIDTNLSYLNGLVVSGGYAYLAAHDDLYIIDIEPPESASIAHTVAAPDTIFGVSLSGGFAYIANGDSGLQIIDIDPPLSAHIISSVDTPDSARGVAVSGDYAYVLEPTSLHPQLDIIDINPPESAYIVKSVEVWWYSSAVETSGGYAYVTDGNPHASGGTIKIFDTDPPESAHLVSSVTIPYDGYGFVVSDGYAYIACHYSYMSTYYSELAIVDIDPPLSAHYISSFATGVFASSVAVSEGYAYVGCNSTGLAILKLW